MSESHNRTRRNQIQWLSPQDKQFYMNDIGIIRPSAVNPFRYNQNYFSDAHVAYSEGYTLQSRLEKYQDAIWNIQQVLEQPIIDLGCGPGFIVEGLRQRDVDVNGVDISFEAIHSLSPIETRPLLHQSPLTQLPFRDNRFNSGYSFHVLEHLTVPELESALGEITRVVQHQLYLIIPTWDRLPNRKLFDQIILDPTHRTIVTREWWINTFAENGWSHNDEIATGLDRLNRGWVFYFEK